MQVCIENPRRENIHFQWLVTQVHRLGPRVIAELLAEIGAEFLIRVSIERKLERYAALDPQIQRAVGADRFPPWPPLRLVSRGDDQ
jgi:hypothetical protein